MECLICVVDTETTGLDAQADFCQLGSILYRPGAQEVLTYKALATPVVPISPKAQEVHGISQAHLVGCPTSYQVAREWWDLVYTTAAGTTTILVGHNLQFDLRILRQHVPEIGTLETIDTLRLARRFAPSAAKHKLEFLFKEHHRLVSNHVMQAHDALTDCWMAFSLLRLYQEKGGQAYSELVIESNRPTAITAMPLGKYKGVALADVPKSYLSWLLCQDWVGDELRKAIETAIRGY